ncbi:MAG: transcription termination factor Rho [Clostridia bacterium]|nr:transcription termination factor Rho [Clostridia bacterium]
MELDIIKDKKVAELREIAAALGIPNPQGLKKKEIIEILTKMHEDAERKRAAAAAKEAEQVAAEKPAEEKPAKEKKAPAAEKPAEKASKKRGRPKKAEPVKPEAEPVPAGEESPEKAAAEPAEEPAKPAEKPSEKSKEKPADKPSRRRGRPKKDEQPLLSEKAEGQPAEEQPAEPPQQVELPAEEKPADEKKPSEKPEKPRRGEEPMKEGRYETTGILELSENGFGFLRFDNFLTSDEDVYVSPVQIRRFNLKTGDEICAIARRPEKEERFGALLFVKTVNGDEPGAAIRRKDFSDLTPIYPEERIRLENGSSALSMRLTDLVAPIGKGQRGLIVAPPKAGKTTLLKQIARAIEIQNVDAELIVLLIDERPEEVTDMQRSIRGNVIYSTFDEQPSHHVKVAEMVLARAQRLVEHGKDVIILLDSITRLARAYNLVEAPSGRTLSGGLDPAALYKPKKFFGAARNIEEGGSITILATALIETGSRMDDVIFEEFKGTGNMELHLDRKLQEKRIFPAININKSGTRREDMLMSQEELEAVWLMRRAVADWGIEEATERVVMELAHTKTNADFIARLKRMRL